MVTRCGANVTLKEAVEETKKELEERRLVSEFEAESMLYDEISEILGLIDYIGKEYVEKRFLEIYKFGCERLHIHLKDKFVLEDYSSDHPIKRGYNQLDNFKKLIKAYNGYDLDAVKYVENVEAFIHKPLDELELEDVRTIKEKVKFPRKLDISVFYQLTGRLPYGRLKFKEEDFIVHFYNAFIIASTKLLGKRLDVELMYYTIC